MARAVAWLALFGVYVAFAFALDPADPSVQAPQLLDQLSGDARTLVLAAAATLAFASATALARRWAPDPWASRGVLAAALSPAGFALSVSTAALAAGLLAAGALGAAAVRDHPTRLRGLGGAGCLALAPWFGVAYAPAAALIGLALVYWTYRRGRRLYAFLALEFAGASAVTLAGVETSSAIGPAPAVDGVLETAAGFPGIALCVVTAVLLVRSRRERLAAAIPAWRDAEVAAQVTGAALVAIAIAAALEPVGPEAGVPLAGALSAWALRAFPRAGSVAVAATLALTVIDVVLLAAGGRAGWL